MKRIPAIKSVMTPFPYSLDVDASLVDALDFLRARDIDHLPVTRDTELVGVLSGRDIRTCLQANADAARAKLGDLQPDAPYTVDLNERLDKVLMAMAQRRLDVALITRHGKLAGVFTLTDVCEKFAEFLREAFRPPGGGEAA